MYMIKSLTIYCCSKHKIYGKTFYYIINLYCKLVSWYDGIKAMFTIAMVLKPITARLATYQNLHHIDTEHILDTFFIVYNFKNRIIIEVKLEHKLIKHKNITT